MQMCPNCSHDNRDSARFCARCQAQLQGLLGANTLLQDRYRVLNVLGCGGMGAVYLAEDTRLDAKRVAVKENFDTSPVAQTQFRREASILAHLTHPHLPAVTDHFVEASGRQYLVMSWVEGDSLLEILGRTGGRPLPEQEVLAWADQLLDALAYCHSRGVIHRDIKPQNVIRTPEGKVVLVDFGLVKLYDPANPSTSLGLRGLGTPEYAAPEQYGAGTGHTEARSDIYSLGATLYHLLTAQPPPSAGQRIANPAILCPPRQLNPCLSPRVEAVILEAMELSMAQRFQSATGMRQALPGGLAAPIQVGGQRAVPHAWLIAGVVGLVLVGVLVGGLLTGGLRLGAPIPTSVPTATVGIALALVSPTPTPVPLTDTPTTIPTLTATAVPPTDTPSPPTDTPIPTSTPTATPSYTPTSIPPTALPPVITSPGSHIIFDGDPRDSAWLCDGGFRSECNFAGCAEGYRLVYGPFCRSSDYPEIETGEYLVTIYGTGSVRAGATDFGVASELFRFGQRQSTLPTSFTFCWPGLHPDGYGFEIIVVSMGGNASVTGIKIEYTGWQC